MPQEGAAERFKTALGTLYTAAGQPPHPSLVERAKPVSLSTTSLSNWFRGTAVPQSGASFTRLIQLLNSLAAKKQAEGLPAACRYRPMSLDRWASLRTQAWDERHLSGRVSEGEARTAEEDVPDNGRATPEAERTIIPRMFRRLGFAAQADAGGDLSADHAPVGFTGRAWLTEKFDNFLGDHSRGYFVLEASAGVGKTAFAAWLSHHRDYAAHFTSLSGCREVVNAVQGIGGQLIRKWGLQEYTVGGQLPTNPGAEWLEAVMEAAAGRSAAEGHPLVIVVDGLDEAQPDASGQPLGLPPELPEGVYVLATLRSGTECAWLRHPYTVCQLTPGDRSNLHDMQRHLERVCAGDSFAALLASADVATEDFIAVLLDRCAGVWIYLRYVLEEVRAGLRPVNAVDQLPGDLWGYYSDNVSRLPRSQEEWEDFYLPLLTTLGVTNEPVTPEALTELAGLTAVSRIRRLLALEWRPFCEATRAGRNVAYSIYHQSLRDYLCGRSPLAPNGSPEFASHRRDDLALGAHTAHTRIADRYLTAWGGLDEGLPALLTDAKPGALDTGYGLRNVPVHLEASHRAEHLHKLLACCHHRAADGMRVNTWYTALNRAGELSHFLAHVARARQTAEHADATKARTACGNQSMGLELRYALMASSLASLAMNTPPEVIGALTTHGVWTFEQSISHIQRRPHGVERVAAMRLLAQHVQGAARQKALREAAINLVEIRNRRELLGELAELLPQLDGDTYVDAVITVIDAVAGQTPAEGTWSPLPQIDEQILNCVLPTLASPGAGAQQAVLLAELTRPGRLRALLQAVLSCGDSDRRDGLLVMLAPLLDHASLAATLAAVREQPSVRARAEILSILVPRLPHPLPRGTWELIEAEVHSLCEGGSGTVIDRVAFLGWLSFLIPAESRHEALDAVMSGPLDTTHARIAAWLDRALPSAEREAYLGRLLDRLAQQSNQTIQRDVLGCLPPLFEQTLRDRVLAIAANLGGRDAARLLLRFGTGTPVDQDWSMLDRTVSVVLELRHEGELRSTLKELIWSVPPRQRRLVARAALEYEDTGLRTEIAADMASVVLPEVDLPLLLAFAERDNGHPVPTGTVAFRRRAGASRTGSRAASDYRQGRLLSALICRLPPPLLPRVVAATARIEQEDHRADVLVEVAARIPADGLHLLLEATCELRTGLTQARLFRTLGERATALGDFDVLGELLAELREREDITVATVLSDLWPVLPPPLFVGALTPARQIQDGGLRATTLLRCLPHATKNIRDDCFHTIKHAIDSLEDAGTRAGALAELLPFAPAAAKAALQRTALACVSDVQNAQSRTAALKGLLPNLSEGQLAPAAALARTTLDAEQRARGLAAVATRYVGAELAVDVAQEATAALSEIIDDRRRIETAADLIAGLPEASAAGILEVVQRIHDEGECLGALASLSAHVPGSLTTEVLRGARLTEDEQLKRTVLTGLISHLPDDLLTEAEEIAQSIADPSERARSLVALAPRLHDERHTAALETAVDAATSIQDERVRADTLTSFPSELPGDLTARILEKAATQRSEWHRASILADMARHLSGGPLLEAFRAARDIKEQWCRARALAGVIPQLPADRLPTALGAVHTIQDAGSRAYVWSRCLPVLSGAARQQAVAQSVAGVDSIGDNWFRLQVLLDLLPQLGEPDHGRLFEVALRSVRSLPTHDERARMFAALSRRTTGARQQLLLAQAMKSVYSIESEALRARTLVHMAEPLSPAYTGEMLTALREIKDTRSRAAGLVDIAAELDGLQDGAFEAVIGGLRLSAMIEGFARSDALRLIGVASAYIERTGGEEAVRECVTAIADVTAWWP